MLERRFGLCGRRGRSIEGARCFIACAMLLGAMGLANGARAQDASPVFETDIYPIFKKNCSGCHFPEAEELKSEFNLSTHEGALAGGKGGATIIPGNAAESRLARMIEWKADPNMPPPEVSKRLRRKQIELIKRWIDEGAKPGSRIVERAEPKPKPRPARRIQPSSPAKPIAAKPESAEKETVQAADSEMEEAPKPVVAATIAPASPISALAYSPDGTRLARGGYKVVEVFELASGSPSGEATATLEGHAEMIRALAFSPDGERLAAAGGLPGREGEVKIWNVGTGAEEISIKGHTDNIFDVAFSPDGRILATCSYDKLVKLWDSTTGEELRTLKNHVDAVYSIAFSADGKLIASGSGDRTVKVWNVEDGALLWTLSDALSAIFAVAFDPTRLHVAGAGADKMIRIWDVSQSSEATFNQSKITGGNLRYSSFAHDGTVLKLAYSPDGATIYSTAEDQRIKAWKAEGLVELRVFEAQPDWVSSVALSPDGSRLAAGRYDSTSVIYDAASGDAVWRSDAPVLVAESEPAEKKAEEEPKETETAKAGGRKKVTSLDVGKIFIEATVPPSIQSISPSRLHRGQKGTLTVRGKNLADAELIMTTDKITAKIIESTAGDRATAEGKTSGTGANIVDNARPYTIKIEIEVADDIGLGGHSLLFRTPSGLTNSQSFSVTAHADVSEEEPAEGEDEAILIETLPAVIAGRINREGDVDRYRFGAEAGQEIVFALTDASTNALLRLFDSEGAELANSDAFVSGKSARLGHRFDEAGDYDLTIADRDLRGSTGYRLHAGEFPYATKVDPLGAPSGVKTILHVAGFNLGEAAGELEIDAPASVPGYGKTIDLPIPKAEGNPIRRPKIAIGAASEVAEAEPNDSAAEAQPVEFPVTVNGGFSEPGSGGRDVDLYRFSAREGETIVLEVVAGRLGSPVDSVLEVLDAEGRLLQRGQVRGISRTIMALSDRDSRGTGFRVENWTDLAIGDHVMIGSEILRVRQVPDYGDEDVVVQGWPNGARRGYFGTTPEHHAVGTPVYKVEILDPGARFAPNGMPSFPVYWRNDDSYFPGVDRGDSRIDFIAPAAGEYIVRVKDAHGAGGERHAYRLAIRRNDPDYTISAGPYRVNVAAGGRVPISVRASRRDGFNGPIWVWAEGLPEGVRLGTGTILPDHNSVSLALDAAADAPATDFDFKFKIIANATIGGRLVTGAANLGTVTVVDHLPDLVVHNELDRLNIAPGKSKWVNVRVDRNNGFDSRVPISVLNLPFGVRVLDTGLNGVLVRQGEFERSMEIYVEPWVKPIKRDIFVQAQIEATSTKPVFLGPAIKLEIAPAGTAEPEPEAPRPEALVASGEE